MAWTASPGRNSMWVGTILSTSSTRPRRRQYAAAAGRCPWEKTSAPAKPSNPRGNASESFIHVLFHQRQVDTRNPVDDLLKSAILGQSLQSYLRPGVLHVFLSLAPVLIDHQISPWPVSLAPAAFAVRPRTNRIALHPGSVQKTRQRSELGEKTSALFQHFLQRFS